MHKYKIPDVMYKMCSYNIFQLEMIYYLKEKRVGVVVFAKVQ